MKVKFGPLVGAMTFAVFFFTALVLKPTMVQAGSDNDVPPESPCFHENTENTASFDHLFAFGQVGNVVVLWQVTHTTATVQFCNAEGTLISVEAPKLDIPANPPGGPEQWNFPIPVGTKYMLFYGIVGEYNGIYNYEVYYSVELPFYQGGGLKNFIPLATGGNSVESSEIHPHGSVWEIELE